MRKFNFCLSESGLCWSWLIVFFVSLDQLTKNIAKSCLEYHASLKINSFFSLTLMKNSGAAFSMLADGHAWQFWLLTIFAISMIGMLFVWLARAKFDNHLYNIAVIMIISGAFGNLIDRISYGGVIDFIDLNIKGYHWPVFNFADVVISLGVVLLFFHKEDKSSA